MTRYLHRPGRWLRRTRWLAAETARDLGLGLSRSPAWLGGNPFLAKSSRTESRRLGLLGRLLATVGLLGGILLGGLWLESVFPEAAAGFLRFLFGLSLPSSIFILLAYVHTTLITAARTALSISLADEARRGTLPDLLLTPLRRAEMLLAMGVAPARTAFLVALTGLPVYLLLVQLGAVTGPVIACLYLLYALLCYAPPVWSLPSGASAALTPETALGRFQAARLRRRPNSGAWSLIGIYAALTVAFLGQVLGVLRGGWLAHLLTALHLHFTPGASFFLFFTWPYYAARILGERLPFFHADLRPLWYLLPLILAHWAASALLSGAALSAEDAPALARLPLFVRARTLARWTARAAGLCALGIVWRAWVESGDTATLVGAPLAGTGGNAAGLLLLLGGLSLPAVCARALGSGTSVLSLRRTARRAIRPLGVAGGMFLAACALGSLSPLAPLVFQTAGGIALVGAVTILWGLGMRRALPASEKGILYALLYGLPLAALSLAGTGLPGVGPLAALSPVPAWVRLFPEASGLLGRFPLWHIAPPPPFALCLAGPALAGTLLLAIRRPAALLTPLSGVRLAREDEDSRTVGALPAAPSSAAAPTGRRRPQPAKALPRHLALTASLLGWVTARTDNPLFIYEIRTRTRSGRWADWGIYAPVALLLGLILTAAYPEFVSGFAFVSPFRFFHGIAPPYPSAWADLASLLLVAQCWMLGFRGQLIGEGLIARDRQRGIWGFILLTPLSSGAIFWGKVFGQTAGAGAVWAVGGAAGLVLYLLATPAVGLAPALAAWLSGQVFVAALFVLGVGVGAVLSPYPIFSKGLRGLSGLVFTALVGLGVWGQFALLPLDTPAYGVNGAWHLMALRLGLGSAYGLALALPLFWLAMRQVAALRARDVAFGDGTE